MRFWGVRGGIPTPSAANLKYGGNTSCVEVCSAGGERLILDAGSGIRALGREVGQAGGRAHVLLSHFHWDHIQGLPFFVPLYREDWSLTICSMSPAEELEARLSGQMREPYFPAGASPRAERRYLQAGEDGLETGDVRVEAVALHHPGGCVGYRISNGCAVVVFATDHEQGNAEADERLLRAARGADLLIYDAQYTPEEYERRKGWGHGTWEAAALAARDAGVRQLALYHHDPERQDAEVDALVEAARQVFPATFAAEEGRVIEVET